MSRRGISSQDVCQAAEALIAQGQTPTQAHIREYLGRGSKGTIHKYLKQWKQNCFQKISHPSSTELIHAKSLFEEKCALEKVIEKQITENERLSIQLVDAERDLMQVQEKNLQLNLAVDQLKSGYTHLEIKYQFLQEAYQVLREEKDTALQLLMVDKNEQINRLMEELKALNETALKAVREQGYQTDDALMQEKVLNLNLKQKVEDLEKTIKNLQTQLIRLSQSEQNLKATLERQRERIATFEQDKADKTEKTK